ncbi:hypothetical protein Csa_004415 [Cucumis sativus]|uniref:Uncharacterized protein n=1 Tax=Cucumis sativus TaxID=3659 RepID=A0A0A0KH39_CUCSA|nr:hypothetical protein Csa_004415 [Cucumis sativus]
MERHNTKRPRESSSLSSPPDGIYDQSSLPEIANVKRQHSHDNAQESSPGTSFDFDLLSFGVFDFPWLKDGLIYSKSDDWKFEDVFFTSVYNGASTADIATPLTIGTAFTEFLPDPWEKDYEAQAPPPPPPSLDGGEQGGEAMDCIWRSVLNQPLQQGSSAL